MNGWAALVSAIAGLVMALAVLVTALRTNRKVEEVKVLAVAIDNAVNGKPVGAPTISEQVDTIEARSNPAT